MKGVNKELRLVKRKLTASLEEADRVKVALKDQMRGVAMHKAVSEAQKKLDNYETLVRERDEATKEASRLAAELRDVRMQMDNLRDQVRQQTHTSRMMKEIQSAHKKISGYDKLKRANR